MARTASIFKRAGSLAPRTRELARIHVGKARLAMSDDEYRAMLQAVARVESAAALDANGRAKVIGHLARLGAFKPRQGDDPQVRLIRRLWHELHAAGAVEHDTEQALGAFCRRVAHKDRPGWLNTMEARTVIEALKSWLARAQAARANKEAECER